MTGSVNQMTSESLKVTDLTHYLDGCLRLPDLKNFIGGSGYISSVLTQDRIYCSAATESSIEL